MTTYEEWRVTGDPGDDDGSPYEFVWSPARNTAFDGGEVEARRFMALIAEDGGWTDGPHLHKRTVTVTDWEEA